MKKNRSGKPSKIEKTTDCVVRILFASLSALLTILSSVTLSIGQPFMNGFILVVSAIILAAMTLGFKEIELQCKVLKLRLRRHS